jgi:fatty-acyl-CoA synthase
MRRRAGPWIKPAFAVLILLGLLPLLLLAVGAVGSKLGWFSWKFGFGVLTVDWAPKAAFVGVAAGGSGSPVRWRCSRPAACCSG